MLFLWIFKDNLHIYHSLNTVLNVHFEEAMRGDNYGIASQKCLFAGSLISLCNVFMLTMPVNQIYTLDHEFAVGTLASTLLQLKCTHVWG